LGYVYKTKICSLSLLGMTKFLLIRHAITHAVGQSLSGRLPGVHLNDAGKVQAEQLSERLKSLPIAAIYTSPLERAVETAGPIAKVLNLSFNIEEDFLEINFGHWTNKRFSALDDDPDFKRFNSFRTGTRIPGGETMQEAQSRMLRGLEKLAVKHPGESVAVVSHSDMIKSAIAFYAGIHLDMFQRIEISPASVSVMELYDDSAKVITLNHTGILTF
jgi:probable phosphomutase (TIGR03848 family)